MTDLQTAVMPEEDLDSRIDTEHGNHDKFSHIVVPASKVTEAYILGVPVKALCGKEWVPSADPKKHPVCPTCREILDGFVLGSRGYPNERQPGAPA